MDKQALIQRILHLREVEKLSLRQIGKELNINRNKVSSLLTSSGVCVKTLSKPGILEPFRELVIQWYKDKPYLKAKQIYERLQAYGFTGSYARVVEFTREYRKRPQAVYHTLTFLPGQEAQVDWFFYNSDTTGKVAGFLYVLSYSRYAWGQFYPKTTFEFFLDGHIKCFQHLGGLAHCHRYDNLKSVVLKRYPIIEYNPQFLDFSRHYGFSIYLCQPAHGNQKGRVERPIRDIRDFLYAETFKDIDDLNNKFHRWLDKRNHRVHRSTDKTPKDLLIEERLIKTPLNPYIATRTIPGVMISKTALVNFENNQYSVPTQWANKPAEIVASCEGIEIWVNNKKIARHKRCFQRKQIIQNPLHAELLFKKTSVGFKMQRIEQLIGSMDSNFHLFLNHQNNEQDRMQVAYCLFKLLKSHSKEMLISAVRELNSMKCFQLKALSSLLSLPELKVSDPLWPKKSEVLDFNYQQRSLNDYDELT